MSQREKRHQRHQRRPKYFNENKLDDNGNQVDDPCVQIDPDDINFDSLVPQKVTKKAIKRKSTTYHDSDQNSDNEGHQKIQSTKKTALMTILTQPVRKTNLQRWVQSQERGFPFQQVHIVLDMGRL